MKHSYSISLLTDDQDFTGNLSSKLRDLIDTVPVSSRNFDELLQALQSRQDRINSIAFLDEKYLIAKEQIILDLARNGTLLIVLRTNSDHENDREKIEADGIHYLHSDDEAHLATLIRLIQYRQTARGLPRATPPDRDSMSNELIALGANAASVAHDFNNILTTILGRTQMLLLEATSPQTLKNLESIERTARDGVNVVNQIMRFLSANEAQDKVHAEINAVVKNAVTMVQESARFAETPNIVCETSFGPPIIVEIDRAMITQVLMNIIFNGVDAMPEGGSLKIYITQEKEQVSIEITDSGCGIGDEELGQVFEPFYSSKGTKGTGLGLSTSQRIVNQHKGKLSIRSQKGRGTTVTVTLPISDEAPTEETTKPTETQLEPKKNGSKSAQILVVDDDESISEILAEILRTSHHTVITAHSVDEGLRRFQSGQFDVVFTDVDMPEKSGFELATAIRNMGSTAPIGFITGWGTSVDAERMKDLGVSRTFPKPFKAAQVLDWVTEAVTNLER